MYILLLQTEQTPYSSPLPPPHPNDGMQHPETSSGRMSLSSSFPFHKRDLACTISVLLILLSSFILRNNVDPFQPLTFPRGTAAPGNQTSSSSGACDYSYGNWVRDDKAPSRSYTEDCPFLDPGFRCRRNGREDSDYLKWRWKPRGCDLPRFNATNMLEKYRSKRIVFAGDSIGRNQWESLICMLAKAVQNQSTIYEKNGNPLTKHKGYLSIMFHDHNLTVEYYRVPFLVVIGRPPSNSSEQIKKAIHVDRLHWLSQKWIDAYLTIFNAGHWWTEDKTNKMGFYFQEGQNLNLTMDTKEAFRRALQTWKQWVVQNLHPEKNRVVFRTYSPVHFRGGSWDKGGSCDHNMGPETNHTELEPEPWNNLFISEAIEEVKNNTDINIQLLNVTYLTEFRKDGHPSSHREPFAGPAVPPVQDCSHWCLPGIPDAWNELLYAYLFYR